MGDRITSARGYHWHTKHVRNQIKPHYLDFENYPEPVKVYDFSKKIDLARETSNPGVDLVSLFVQSEKPTLNRPFDLNLMAQILFLAYGVTQKGYGGGRPFFFRTPPSAGGLYPCHLYLAVRRLEGLETGLYYCDMIQAFLGLIQSGVDSVQEKKAVSFSLIITGEFYKSAWKYRDRAFRYILLDAGHLIENISLGLKAFDQDVSINYDFDDEKLSKFLSLDTSKEVPLAWVTVGADEQSLKDLFKAVPDLTGPVAEKKQGQFTPISYPLLKKIYDLGKKVYPDTVTRLQHTPAMIKQVQKAFPLSDVKNTPLQIDYMDVVFHRRSKRNFIPGKFAVDKAEALIKLAATQIEVQPNPADKAESYLVFGISCQDVEGIEDGVYIFSRDRSDLLLISRGQFQGDLSRVCLDQKWITNAGMNFLFLANLSALESDLGPRGYRHLLMHAGRIAQRLYLAATGLGLGCCGVGALYDEEAQRLFGLSGDDALFYVVATGPVKK